MENISRNSICMLAVLFCLPCALLTAQGDYLSGGMSDQGAEGRQATISVPRANIRYGPDTKNYKIVVTLSKGDTVTVYQRKGEWYAIDFPDKGKVWIFGKYVDVLGNEGTVNANNVTLRADSRFTGLAIGETDKGTRVKVLSRRGKWLRISPPSSLRAYVHSNLIQLASEEQHELTVFKSGQRLRVIPKWESSPEGKELRDIEKQLYVYKQNISFVKSKESELNKTKGNIRDLQKELKTIIQKSASTNIKEGASVIFQKAEKLIEYIDAILRLRMLLVRIEQNTKEKIEDLKNRVPERTFGGYVDDVGRFIGRPSRYVLKRGDSIVCFLISKKYNLKDYYYTEVAITDFKPVRSAYKGKPVLLVTDMEPKGQHTWKNVQ